jgi:putrescine aminotransferase
VNETNPIHPVAAEMLAQISSREGEGAALFRDYINPGFVKLLGLAGFGRRYVSAQGCEMIDEEGRRYLDFVGGYGVLNLGHNHPAVQDSLRVILERNLPSFSQVECGLLTGLAAETICARLPKPLNRVFFCNSGSEAVDSAVKLARAATGKKRVLCCVGGYHGNMLGVLGLTDNPKRRDGHRPLLPGIARIPFDDIDALVEVLKWKDVAALVVEPILGEGGVVVPKADYLSRALQECHKHGALLIVDEVQTGFGRTGALFAFEHSGVVPDLIACAKALGGGLVPVGCMVAQESIFGKAYGSMSTCLDHRTTFGGGPMAMAAVLATLETIERENLVAQAREVGAYAKERLQDLAKCHDRILAVCGQGLMIGIEIRQASLPGLAALLPVALAEAAATLYAQYVAIRLIKDHGIIIQVAANALGVIKVMPPLIVDRPAIDRLVAALDIVLADKGYVGALADLARQTMAAKDR